MPYSRRSSSAIDIIARILRAASLGAVCLVFIRQPSAHAAAAALRLTLPPTTAQTQVQARARVQTLPNPQGIALPKSLDALREALGEPYLCSQRGNFLVAGDLAPSEYEYLVDGVLDYCVSALTGVFFDRDAVREKVVNVLVFKDYDSYETGLRRILAMDPISPYGHYGHSQKYIAINYDTGPGTMVHELTHALMAEDFPEAPIWLAEGMASLYEQCRAEGEILRGDDNWRLPELKAALEAGTLGPLSELLAMTPSAFRGGGESLHYAYARYFCKYLEEMGLLPTVYKGFRGQSGRDPTGGWFISQAFGKPLATVEASWRRWISFQYWKE